MSIDTLDQLATLRAERFKEAGQRLLGSALRDPHHPTGSAIGDNRQILVTAFVSDLIDPELEQTV
jgi:hypothetical protein